MQAQAMAHSAFRASTSAQGSLVTTAKAKHHAKKLVRQRGSSRSKSRTPASKENGTAVTIKFAEATSAAPLNGLANGAANGAIAPDVPKPAAKPTGPAKPKGFTNTQRFVVSPEVLPAFEAEWQARQAVMARFSGFLGFTMEKTNGEYVCTSRWESIPEWEAFNLSAEARRSHLPLGIWQYVPKRGEGFPEDFVPFKDFVTACMPKY